MLRQTLGDVYSKLVNLDPVAPRSLAANFAGFDPEKLPEFKELIIRNLLNPLSATHADTPEGRADVETHVSGRLSKFRNYYVPWINSLKKIRGSSILEIGCGTGASTQALAEQGALVTGIDVDQKALDIATFRLKHSAQHADLLLLNAEHIRDHFKTKQFDMVIFFAALEHMTTDEKISSLGQAYDLLAPGGALLVLEAPNRLWFYDFHTAFLPFYLWLPEDLSIRYAIHSERSLFRNAMTPGTTPVELARWGRGVSYHEFELAGIPAKALSATQGTFQYYLRKNRGKQLLYSLSLNHAYKKILRKMSPAHIPASFREPFLDLCIIKR
jgi:2-polyprenyl-3-methyl-5-hydroxy-6-metoxy-1,4-benzoquinol methylase